MSAAEVREAERHVQESRARSLGHVLADARNKAAALECASHLTDTERKTARAARLAAIDALDSVDALLLSLRVNA